MKAIQGFITDDGQFFENRDEAHLHERTAIMKTVLEEDGMSEDILEWINKRHKEIANYLRIEVNARRPISDPKITKRLNSQSV